MLRAMKRALFLLLVVGVLMALAPAPSGAITDLGEVCFGFTGFPDTIRAEVLQSANIAALSFRWRLGSLYELGGSGSASASSVSPGKFMLALVGAHGTAAFGGNQTCSLFATLNPPTFSGPFRIQCSGAAVPFTVSGTMNSVACGSLALSALTPDEVAGPGLGE
jgi:hypothetical protein